MASSGRTRVEDEPSPRAPSPSSGGAVVQPQRACAGAAGNGAVRRARAALGRGGGCMGQGGFPPPSAADPDDWLVSHEDWGSFSPLAPPHPPAANASSSRVGGSVGTTAGQQHLPSPESQGDGGMSGGGGPAPWSRYRCKKCPCAPSLLPRPSPARQGLLGTCGSPALHR